MNVLLINGSPHPHGCTYTALREAADELERQGIETEIFQIGPAAVHSCTGCGGCRKTGLCVFTDDGVNACIEKLRQADGVIVGAPVHYAGPAGAATAAARPSTNRVRSSTERRITCPTCGRR